MADIFPGFSRPPFTRVLMLLGCVVLGLSLSSCAFLAAAEEEQNGKRIAATYKGLDKKTLAIVVYPDPSIAMEYTDCRKEISAYVTGNFHQNMPTVRLVNYNDVVNWQDDTREWQGLQMKDIGRHFSVDRVLYIELLDYRTREPGAANLLRGRIQAHAEVYEIDSPSSNPIWQQTFDVYWPEQAPLDALTSSDDTVRKHVLEDFSDQLVGNFYDHRKLDQTVREKEAQ